MSVLEIRQAIAWDRQGCLGNEGPMPLSGLIDVSSVPFRTLRAAFRNTKRDPQKELGLFSAGLSMQTSVH